MNLQEYKKTRRRTDDSGHLYLDLRTFGPRESEAILFCLEEASFAVSHSRKIKRKIVLICEPTTKLPGSVDAIVREINAQGQLLEIRPQHRETSE